MTKEGFIQSNSDYSLFTKHSKAGFIAVLVYVDDIIISSSNNRLIDQFKACLSSHFKLKDVGCLQFFLDLKLLDQSKEW